jgi:hypothetical protein
LSIESQFTAMLNRDFPDAVARKAYLSLLADSIEEAKVWEHASRKGLNNWVLRLADGNKLQLITGRHIIATLTG